MTIEQLSTLRVSYERTKDQALYQQLVKAYIAYQGETQAVEDANARDFARRFGIDVIAIDGSGKRSEVDFDRNAKPLSSGIATTCIICGFGTVGVGIGLSHERTMGNETIRRIAPELAKGDVEFRSRATNPNKPFPSAVVSTIGIAYVEEILRKTMSNAFSEYTKLPGSQSATVGTRCLVGGLNYLDRRQKDRMIQLARTTAQDLLPGVMFDHGIGEGTLITYGGKNHRVYNVPTLEIY